MPDYQQIDLALRDDLLAHRTDTGLTNAGMAKLFDVSATFISKYLNAKLDRDVGDFEDRARDILAAIRNKLQLENQLFETSVTRSIHGRIEMARRTSDVCLIHGVAGEGKTSGAQLYSLAHPSTFYHKITGRSRDAEHIQSGIFNQLSLRNFDYSKPRWDILVERFKGTSSAVIIDNAHRLSRSGRDFLFDLNEETGVAVILIGNPEILKWIKGNDQQHSRIGVAGESSFDNTAKGKKELPDVARRVALQFSDEDFADEVSDLAAYVAQRPGRLRAVRKTTILARELAAEKKLDPRQAFRAAHKQLVRDYHLPAD